MICRRFISFCLASLVLSSCSTTQTAGTKGSENAPPVQSESDKLTAQAKLERMLEAKHKKQEQLDAQEQAAAAKQAAAQAEAAKPHYDPERLRMAVNWRQWANITIPDLNIQAWLKSNWKDGKMHMRLALLGDKTALRIFTGQWKYLRIVFADQNGNNLHQAMLSTTDLHWADSLRNSGTPTMEFEGDSEVNLEIYESIVQWNLLWENESE